MIVKKGRANDILKVSAHRRKTKTQLAEERMAKAQERRRLDQLQEIEETLKSKKMKMDDVPEIVRRNEQLAELIKSKGLHIEEGQMKS